MIIQYNEIRFVKNTSFGIVPNLLRMDTNLSGESLLGAKSTVNQWSQGHTPNLGDVHQGNDIIGRQTGFLDKLLASCFEEVLSIP